MERTRDPERVGRPTAATRGTSLLVSCSRCHRLHGASDGLEFDPVCARCARIHPFGTLGMDGSFPLTHAAIDESLTRRAPGNYALGYMDGATFVVFYVGRSDADVRRRLHAWVGRASRSPRYAARGMAAWGRRRGRRVPIDVPARRPVDLAVGSSYTHFAYSYAPSADAAFANECRNFDDFRGSEGLDNPHGPVPTAPAPVGP